MNCKFCGEINDEGSRFCVNCGKPLEQKAPQQDNLNSDVQDIPKTDAAYTENIYSQSNHQEQTIPQPKDENQEEQVQRQYVGAETQGTVSSYQPKENTYQSYGSSSGSNYQGGYVSYDKSYEAVNSRPICTVCSAESEPGMSFCYNCGAQLPVQQAAVVKKPSTKRIILVFLAILLVVLIASFLLINTFKHDSKTTQVDYSMNVIVLDDETAIVINGKLSDNRISGKVSNGNNSVDFRRCALITHDDVLHYVKEGDIKEVAADVSYCKISMYGDTIVYIDIDDELYLYNCQDGKATSIAQDVEKDEAFISPDGKTLIYYQDDEAFVYSNGKSESLGDGLQLVSVSNGGEYIYYIDKDKGNLYIDGIGKDREKLGSNVSGSIGFNKDRSQIIFASNDKLNISEKGGEKKKISGSGELNLVLSRTLAASYETYDDFYCITYGIDSFGEKFYMLADTLIYIDKNYESTKVAGSAEGVSMTDDGKTVFYVKSDNVYKVTSDNLEEPEKLIDDEDAKALRVSDDGKFVFFVNSAGDLLCKKGDGESEKIAEDVTGAVFANDNMLLLVSDGSLYYCDNGKDKQKISDDAVSCYAYKNVAYYAVEGDDGYDIYSSKGDSNFSLILSGVEELPEYFSEV